MARRNTGAEVLKIIQDYQAQLVSSQGKSVRVEDSAYTEEFDSQVSYDQRSQEAAVLQANPKTKTKADRDKLGLDRLYNTHRADSMKLLPAVLDVLGEEAAEIWADLQLAGAAYGAAEFYHRPEILEHTQAQYETKIKAQASSTTGELLAHAALHGHIDGVQGNDQRTEWIRQNAGHVRELVSSGDINDVNKLTYEIAREWQLTKVQLPPMPQDGDGDDEGQQGQEQDSQGKGKSKADNDKAPEDKDQDDSQGDGDERDDQDSEGDGQGDSDQDDDSSPDSGGDDSQSGGESDSGPGSDSESGLDSSGSGGSPDNSDGQGSDKKPQGQSKGDTQGGQSKNPFLDKLHNAAEKLKKINPPPDRPRKPAQITGPVRGSGSSQGHNWHVMEDPRIVPVKTPTMLRGILTEFLVPSYKLGDDTSGEVSDFADEIRMGNLDVFQIEERKSGKIIIAVDCSLSMTCTNPEGPPWTGYRKKADIDSLSAGRVAWQAAAAIGKAFPEAHVFGYSGDDMSSWVANFPAGYRPACPHCDSQNKQVTGRRTIDMSGTPECTAYLYAESLLKGELEGAACVVITDGVPNDVKHTRELAHQFFRQGMAFAVIEVGPARSHYLAEQKNEVENAKRHGMLPQAIQKSQQRADDIEFMYPAALHTKIEDASELHKIAKTLEFLRMRTEA